MAEDKKEQEITEEIPEEEIDPENDPEKREDALKKATEDDSPAAAEEKQAEEKPEEKEKSRLFRNNRARLEAERIAGEVDAWMDTLGYRREGAYYRCVRPDDIQRTVALFSHGGSSAAAMGHILNLPFPYACGLFHLEFTGITVIRLDRRPGSMTLPCLELANDGRHIRGAGYHRLKDM